ncbi:FAD/NAD(P)-binding protein [Streptomyces sp. NBC_00237]|uniref:FAD/NAD(P)-binding protein n=1 Tax=Streptomyces sp. NBC_00237 TaxID=2975687 RepID=UPI0022518547|nr:FAD/NAD(P)-binding protein [Streptomyces sp. NBC_00237]MCX5202172.1 FAD/NAD(P)-binding protein [Streptomyces sp. NBC_00237]
MPASAVFPPSAPLPRTDVPSLVLIGAGPRGTGLLERVAANLPSLWGSSRLDIHLVDPYPPGGGRIWRRDQSPLLWMNSRAEDTTLFTDDSVRMAGPVRTGPTLAEWVALVRDGALPSVSDPEVRAEAGRLGPRDFVGRRVQSAYLAWAYAEAVAALPEGVRVHEHRTRARRVTGPRDGRQRVWLEGRTEPLHADAVVLALGHLDTEPAPIRGALEEFARRRGLTHLPPAFTADADLTALRGGEPVLVRGFGLAFVDLMVLLTEGRGGRYESDGRGELTYLPSGREPVLHVGSRRGVPYRSKLGYGWPGGEQPVLPRFFGPEQVAALRARGGAIDFRRDVWPLIGKELGYAHYHRLFTAHPERTALTRADFEERYAAAAPGSAEEQALLASAVPDPADRLDLGALDRPLEGRRFGSYDALQAALRDHVRDDLTRRHDPLHSPDAAVFGALLSVYGQVVALGDLGEGGEWWHGFFSYLGSGPPGPRLRQLLALSRAGVVRFLGAGVRIVADERRGVFRAGSESVPGAWVEAKALVEARVPGTARPSSPLLRGLYEDGAEAADGSGLLKVDPHDGRVRVRAGGGAGAGTHRRRFALGPFTTDRTGAAFSRPHGNAPAFRQNDAAARELLRLLGELRDARGSWGSWGGEREPTPGPGPGPGSGPLGARVGGPGDPAGVGVRSGPSPVRESKRLKGD